MQKRKWLALLYIGFLVIQGIFLITAISQSKIVSNYDVEFKYRWDWKVRGTAGRYYGVSEDFNAIGHYKIQFQGTTARVTGTVEWTYKYSDGYGENQDNSSKDIIDFTYSRETLEYLTGHDQDFNATTMQVWFYTFVAENDSPSDTYWLLDQEYQFSGVGTYWTGLVPFKGTKIVSSGEFNRNDAYGTFRAYSTSEMIFNKDGWILGENYKETDKGTGAWSDSEFEKSSTIRIFAASYEIPIDYISVLLVFWLPFVGFLVVIFPIYNVIRWKPRLVQTQKGPMTIMQGIQNKPIELSSNYIKLIPEYLHRAVVFNEKIVSAVLNDKVVGIGILDKEGHVGSFFGSGINELIKYANPYVFFTEFKNERFSTIEEYKIFKCDNLTGLDLSYDTQMISPLRAEYINPIKKIISIEDVGNDDIKNAKWVDKSRISDLIYVAKVPVSAPWVQEILASPTVKKYSRPDIINGEVIIGCAFCTPSEKMGWLYGLYVHPAFRNRGIGRHLVNARLSALRDLGYEAITEMATWNAPVQKIYSKLNFQLVGAMFLQGKKPPKIKINRR